MRARRSRNPGQGTDSTSKMAFSMLRGGLFGASASPAPSARPSVVGLPRKDQAQQASTVQQRAARPRASSIVVLDSAALAASLSTCPLHHGDGEKGARWHAHLRARSQAPAAEAARLQFVSSRHWRRSGWQGAGARWRLALPLPLVATLAAPSPSRTERPATSERCPMRACAQATRGPPCPRAGAAAACRPRRGQAEVREAAPSSAPPPCQASSAGEAQPSS